MPTITNGDPNNPDQMSGERQSMSYAWELITDVLSGVEAIRKKPKYLPKYEGESSLEHNRRLQVSPWRPEFEDCLRGLAAKPFGKDVSVDTKAPPRFAELAEDIDGRGNSITEFARNGFLKGVAKGIHAILIDYPDMHPAIEGKARPITVAEEKAAGVRPYWVHIEADSIIALYTSWQEGREIIEHIRFKENFVIRDKFTEKLGERIRIYEPGRWEVWEKLSDEQKFTFKNDGVISRAGRFNSVPIVLFYTGERDGELKVKPPLLDLAEMQIELFRAMSRKDEVMTYASSPMLTANGMKKDPKDGPLSVGPKTVLYASASGASWDYINPDHDNIKEIRADVRDIQEDMKRLGMQPLVAKTGRVTATGESIDAAKAQCTVKAWAVSMKDVLEQAFVITGEWINEKKAPEVTVYTDFTAIPANREPLNSLATARATGDISRETLWTGLQRFDVLPADFDAVKEQKLLAKEEQDRQTAAATALSVPKRDPVTGMAVPAPPPKAAEPSPTTPVQA